MSITSDARRKSDSAAFAFPSPTPWSKCALCQNAHFKSPSEFSKHLKEVHSSKKGGCLICSYSPNALCSTYTPNGVKDGEHAEHVRNNHSSNFDFTRSQESVPSVVSVSVKNDSDRQRWTPYLSQVNLPAVLNDPRLMRRQTDFFTRTWGDAYDRTDVLPNPAIPTITRDDLKTYLRRTTKRLRDRQSVTEEKVAEEDSKNVAVDHPVFRNRPQVPNCSSDLDQVPKIFMSSSFSLEDPATFRAIFPWTDVSSSRQDNGKHRQSAKLLQEKLSHYLDIIEVQIAKQISLRADVFFNAIMSHDKLQVDMRSTCAAITCLRRQIQGIDYTVVHGALKISKLTRLKNNHKQIFDKLKMMSTVHQTQPTVQMLLSTGEFVGALDLIATTQEVLQQELHGVVCFRHLGSQLTELTVLIDKMIQEEFIKYINEELNISPTVQDIPIKSQDALVSLVLGYLRVKKFNFLHVLREEAFLTLKAVLKQTVIEAVSKADDDDLNSVSLADQMRQLQYIQWIQLFQTLFTNLLVVLQRIKVLSEIVQDVLDLASGHSANPAAQPSKNSAPVLNTEQQSNGHQTTGNGDNQRSGDEPTELVGNQPTELSNQPTDVGNQPTSNGKSDHHIALAEDIDLMLTHAEYIQESHHVTDLLCEVCDFAHNRCEKFLVARAKDGFLDRLKASEFVCVSQAVEHFVQSCQNICGRKSTALRACLQTQATKFISRFHDEHRNKLALILDNERWKKDDVPAEFQNLVDHINQTGKLQLPLKKASPEVLPPREYLYVNGQQFAVVGTVLMLLKMTVEYCQCVEDIPGATPDIMIRLIEILKTFNSRSCQLILGAGALQLVGLKTITTKNLALASRCLQLIVFYIPTIRHHFDEFLPPTKQHMLKNFDHLLKDYNDHIVELESKLVVIIDAMLDQHLSKWEVKPPMPSMTFRNICQQMSKLHEAIVDLLPQSQIVMLFQRIHKSFSVRLRLQLMKHGVTNDGGPQHSLVMSDIAFYKDNIKRLQYLDVLEDLDQRLDDIWDKT